MKRSRAIAIVVAALAVCTGVMTAPVAALAAEANDGADAAAYIRYVGTETHTLTSGPADDLQIESTSTDARVEIRCPAPGECRLLGVEPEGFRDAVADGIPISVTDGRAERSQKAFDDACSSVERSGHAGALTVVANAREITVTWTMPSIECPPPDEDVVIDDPAPEPVEPTPTPTPPVVVPGAWLQTALSSAPDLEYELDQLDQTWTASYVEGDGCLVEASACPTASPSPAPVDPVPAEPSPRAPTPTPAPAPEPSASEPVVPPPAPAPSPSAASPAEAAPVDAVAASWSEPSVLSDLSPVVRLDLDPMRLGVCAALAIVLVLLIVFPTARLNSAVERAADLWPKQRTRPPRHLGGWWQAAIGVVIASVITGFVDPEFGWNVTSARVVATLMVALVIDVVLGWSARVWLMRRLYPHRPVTFRFVPVTLLIVAGAVVLSRFLDFEPAIIFGLVAGIALSSALSVSEQARTELVAVGYGLVVSLAAWALYTVLPNSPRDPVSLFAHETLSAAAIAGAASLPLILFPLRGLPGHAVFRWRPAVWAAVYALAVFVFAGILMPMPESWAEVQLPLTTWTIIYLLYVAVAVVASKIVDRLEAARLSAA